MVRRAIGKSPTALKMLKYAFHAETDGRVVGVTHLGVGGLSMFYDTEESLEGRNAFMEKRKPGDFPVSGKIIKGERSCQSIPF
ncbi:MAG: hypothetical protein R2861_16045 [Desulfobacterales bacterium]